jgi:hypothetical protein
MKYADETSESEEPRIRLDQHALDLVELGHRRSALLRRGLLEAKGKRGKELEFEIRHGLEDDLERQGRRCFVDLDVLRSEVPELVGVDDGKVVAFGAGLISYVRNEMNDLTVVG